MSYKTFRRRIYEILEKARPGDTLSYITDLFIMVLIILNIVAIMLETVTSLSQSFGNFFHLFNVVSTVIFTVEYVARVWVSVEEKQSENPVKSRIRYIFSFMAIVDLLAILPLYLSFFPIDMRFVRILRLLRTFRIFKIGRYSNSLGTMVRIFRKKRDDLIITYFIIIVFIIFFSNIMFHIENQAQTEVYSNVFQAMWWSIVTITGVGYGDIYPITVVGKISAGAITMLGMLIIALPIGILGAAYVEDTENKKRGRIRRINATDHLIFCGYNRLTGIIINSIYMMDREKKIILVTEKENPDIPGAVYVRADWTDINVMEQIGIRESSACIIMTEESSLRLTDKNEHAVDMRTIFMIYNIKRRYPRIHTVAEIINSDYVDMVTSNLKGDEIILKERIDGNLIANCIRIPGISRLLYEIVDLDGKIIRETTCKKLGLKDALEYKDVLLYGIEHDLNFIGYIRGEENISRLSPSKNDKIFASDRFIYIADRGEE